MTPAVAETVEPRVVVRCGFCHEHISGPRQFEPGETYRVEVATCRECLEMLTCEGVR